MDEGNRLLRIDPDFETGLIHIPGTKTEKSECYLAMSSALQAELKAYLATRTDDSPYLFPGRRLFEKIRRVTAFKAYMKKNPGTSAMKVWKKLKMQGYPGPA